MEMGDQNCQINPQWIYKWIPSTELRHGVTLNEVIPGPFKAPKLVRAIPYVICNRGNPPGPGNHRRGIPDSWMEYILTKRHLEKDEEIIRDLKNTAIIENIWRTWGVSAQQGIPDPWSQRLLKNPCENCGDSSSRPGVKSVPVQTSWKGGIENFSKGSAPRKGNEKEARKMEKLENAESRGWRKSVDKSTEILEKKKVGRRRIPDCECKPKKETSKKRKAAAGVKKKGESRMQLICCRCNCPYLKVQSHFGKRNPHSRSSKQPKGREPGKVVRSVCCKDPPGVKRPSRVERSPPKNNNNNDKKRRGSKNAAEEKLQRKFWAKSLHATASDRLLENSSQGVNLQQPTKDTRTSREQPPNGYITDYSEDISSRESIHSGTLLQMVWANCSRLGVVHRREDDANIKERVLTTCRDFERDRKRTKGGSRGKKKGPSNEGFQDKNATEIRGRKPENDGSLASPPPVASLSAIPGAQESKKPEELVLAAQKREKREKGRVPMLNFTTRRGCLLKDCNLEKKQKRKNSHRCWGYVVEDLVIESCRDT